MKETTMTVPTPMPASTTRSDRVLRKTTFVLLLAFAMLGAIDRPTVAQEHRTPFRAVDNQTEWEISRAAVDVSASWWNPVPAPSTDDHQHVPIDTWSGDEFGFTQHTIVAGRTLELRTILDPDGHASNVDYDYCGTNYFEQALGLVLDEPMTIRFVATGRSWYGPEGTVVPGSPVEMTLDAGKHYFVHRGAWEGDPTEVSLSAIAITDGTFRSPGWWTDISLVGIDSSAGSEAYSNPDGLLGTYGFGGGGWPSSGVNVSFSLWDNVLEFSGSGEGLGGPTVCNAEYNYLYEAYYSASTIVVEEPAVLSCTWGSATYGEFADFGPWALDGGLNGPWSRQIEPGIYPLVISGMVNHGMCDFSASLRGVVDCDENGIDDLIEIDGGLATDSDGDGIPDHCEPDCNGNGADDALDLANETSFDCNENGIPDECEVAEGDGTPDCEEACPADLDGDGTVDGADLGRFLLDAGTTCDPDLPCPADFNGDGEVTGGDLGLLLVAWGACP